MEIKRDANELSDTIQELKLSGGIRVRAVKKTAEKKKMRNLLEILELFFRRVADRLKYWRKQ